MQHVNIITRRGFLDRSFKVGLGVALSTLVDIPLVVRRALAEGTIGLNGKKLFFIFLRGANDSLNSVIPIQDDGYYNYGTVANPIVTRPNIGIQKDVTPGAYTTVGDCFDATKYSDLSKTARPAALATFNYTNGIPLGNGFAAHLDSRIKPLADPDATALVERVLKAVSHRQALRVPIRLRILDTAEPVASALPGGFLLLSPGAIVRANTESELAALIAHALAHMQAAPEGPVRRLGAWGECWRSGAEVLAPLSVLEQARGSETQADMLALDYLAQSHYDVSALIAVYERLRARFPPDEAVKARARSLTQAGAVVNTSEFDKIKARLTPPPARAITAQVITMPFHLVAIPQRPGEVRFEKVDK